MSLRVVQITDTHLFADPAGRLADVETDRSLRGVLAAVRALEPRPEVVLLTGDLGHDESRAAYERLARHAGELFDATGADGLWLAGNHDVQEHVTALDRGRLSPAKSLERAGWRLVLLDSHADRVVEGALSDDQLAFLERELAAATDAGQHVLVGLHHPLLPVGSAWIDRQRVANADRALEILDRFDCVAGVVAGHVHQEREERRHGVPHWTTPSTCFQFRPGTPTFELDPEPPGFRVLDLAPDGTIATAVRRVPAAYQVPSR
jgi:Icc protein